MPITGNGWEAHFVRTGMQTKPGSSKKRTVGNYQIYHDGVAQTGPDMSGMFAETRGPGDNGPSGISRRRVEEDRYPLWTQDGAKYCTIGYVNSNVTSKLRRASLELKNTGSRTEILIHPASGFLWSVGCLNLCTNIPNGGVDITFKSSRRRVISMIDDLAAYAGAGFPTLNGRAIPNAWAVIDGEP